MDSIINSILAVMPTGLWETIIVAFESFFGTFALSIIVLTIIIKVITSPIDFFNRRQSKNMTSMSKKIQPQVDAINKKYANDSKTRNQKLGELYQREKINPMGSCGIMILSLVVTMFIFITLFNGMNSMAAYKITDQYEQLQIEYVQEYAQSQNVDIVAILEENNNKANDDETKKSIFEICKPYIDELAKEENVDKKLIADQKVAEKYVQIKEGFLWIDNIWMADSPFVNSIPNFDSYVTVSKISKDDANYEAYKVAYEQIMTPLAQTNGRANGYFILVVLCAGIAFLNQWLLAKRSKKEGAQKTSIASFIVMPLIMAIFTLLYTTTFSLYIIASQIVSIALLPLLGKISDAVDKRQKKKNEPTDRLKRI